MGQVILCSSIERKIVIRFFRNVFWWEVNASESMHFCVCMFIGYEHRGQKELIERGQSKVQVQISPSTGNSMNKIPSK